ncbi:hypothetical protein ABEB36_003070 [Hypothenemus hampei]|uniref:Fibronectin type-III domain-containing protein n=1 Tax=Hypothenemus hampei TaxID=57062 RepID=A0ABD1FAJ9_HYPHA
MDITLTENSCLNISLEKVTILETFATLAVASVTVSPKNISNTCDHKYTISLNTSEQNITLEYLLEYTDIECKFTLSVSNSSKYIDFRTQDQAPRELSAVAVSPSTCLVFWSNASDYEWYPSVYNITITRYHVGNEDHFLRNCSPFSDVTTWTDTITGGITNYTFDSGLPDFNYTIEVIALFNAGFGREATTSCVTQVSASQKPEYVQVNYTENVTTADVEMSVDLSWDAPCNTNGPVKYFVIELSGVCREENTLISNRTFTIPIDSTNYSSKYFLYISNLTAASNYTVEIFATIDPDGQFHGEEAVITFSTNDNFPIFNESELSNIEFNTSATQAAFTIRETLFNITNGNLQYIAIMVSNKNISGGVTYKWDNITLWPEPQEADGEIYYQATRPFWNPFLNDTFVDVILGDNQNCTGKAQFCNRPLSPNATYYVYIRMFNSGYYRDTMPLVLVTDVINEDNIAPVATGVNF